MTRTRLLGLGWVRVRVRIPARHGYRSGQAIHPHSPALTPTHDTITDRARHSICMAAFRASFTASFVSPTCSGSGLGLRSGFAVGFGVLWDIIGVRGRCLKVLP